MYHMHSKTISRGKGDSACAASAYRSGGKINDEYYGKTYDYTNKPGIMYSEILLPSSAPIEFNNRESLWNAVELAEKRRDSQLAREVEISLPNEFALEHNIAIVIEYITENFVSVGMIADLAIHDKGNGNPHAHILLTTREVSNEGFSKFKNIQWNKRQCLIKWRKSWANILNREYEKLGLTKRVSHESYKMQGIDKEPTVHLGKTVMALERQGVKTERGNINRHIQKRCLEKENTKEHEYERSYGYER